MLSQRTLESFVGLFLLAVIGALLVLAFKVSGLTSFFQPPGYAVTAQFDDIGSLKVRAPVKVGGVIIGEVAAIVLDPVTFHAVATLHINSHYNQLPDDSSAAILTAGLLGDNYIALTPMYAETYLHAGSVIADTHSAMILEKLIGQMVYKVSNTNGNAGGGATETPSTGDSGAAKSLPIGKGENNGGSATVAPNQSSSPEKNQAAIESKQQEYNSATPVIAPKKPSNSNLNTNNKARTTPVEINYERFV